MVWIQKNLNKFHNVQTVYKGRKYDSKHEASVAAELDLLRKSGQVIKVDPQRTFDLYGKNGNRICGHRVDFLVTWKDGHEEVWEAKAKITMTPEWAIKRKLFEDNYPDIQYTVIMGQTWWTKRPKGRWR